MSRPWSRSRDVLGRLYANATDDPATDDPSLAYTKTIIWGPCSCHGRLRLLKRLCHLAYGPPPSSQGTVDRTIIGLKLKNISLEQKANDRAFMHVVACDTSQMPQVTPCVPIKVLTTILDCIFVVFGGGATRHRRGRSEVCGAVDCPLPGAQ